MATIVWKFVDTPVAAPATLLDMNLPGNIQLNFSKDFDISPPPKRRNYAQNMMTEGSLPTQDAYENRVLVFSVMIHGSKTQKMLLLKALTDEVSKPTNLLMYQPDSSQPPVFFRTFSGDDFKVINNGGNAEVWQVDFALEAEPFAIGLRRDLASIAVNNDPAAASGNKVFFDISGIVGDAATNAFVKTDTMGAGGQAIISTRSVNNPQSLTLLQQAESATLGVDTTSGADAAASGGNRTNTTFASNSGLVARWTFNAPSGTDPSALRGRYRVFGRFAGLTAALNVTLRWRQTINGDFVPGPLVSVDISPPNWQFIDLGIIEYPAPQWVPEQIGYSNLPPGLPATALELQAQRNSGTGTLLCDYFYLIPAQERICCTFQYNDIPGGFICLDGPNDATYGMASGSSPFSSTLSTRIVDNQRGIVTRIGGLPMLVPNANQRWYVLHSASANGTIKNFVISYWPRWREVATV